MAGLLLAGANLAFCQVSDSVAELIKQRQYDLSTDGRTFLLREAADASFFLLGELHGENEIPALIRDIWPSMWRSGYRHIAGEMSPWAANRLEFGTPGSGAVSGLWSQGEASFVTSFKNGVGAVLWGCDMDEAQPGLLIRDLAAANPGNKVVQSMNEIVASGYRRSMAPQLAELLRGGAGIKDVSVGGQSLQHSIANTLEIETLRLNSDSRLAASLRREALMKELFLDYYKKNSGGAIKPKVLARFGRNHLHRGYDRRGVSTVGNFIAEFAFSQELRVFNLAAFGAGGKLFWGGSLLEWDERKDDPAFEFLASLARYTATVFDLRPIRQPLHRIPENKRSAVERSLLYWADSYDAILCYREVTPTSRGLP